MRPDSNDKTTLMRWTRALLSSTLAASAGLGFLGCKGSEKVPFEEVPDRYAAAACDHLDQCLGPLSEILFGSDCPGAVAREIADTSVPLWEAAMEAGTLEYDPKAAADCLDRIRTAGCDASFPRGVCDDVFRGTVAVGEDCTIHEECAGDAYCDLGTGCPGQCRQRGAAGAGCDTDDACRTGLACMDASCAAPLAAGSPCSDEDACGGLSTCLDGRCAPLRDTFVAAVGESCDPEAGRGCVEGASCVLTGFDATTSTPEWTCESPSSSGGPCKVGFPDPCPSNEYCDADPATTLEFEGTCQPRRGAGQPCEDGGDLGTQQCSSGLECLDGVCGSRKRLGDSCSSGGECLSGNCESGTCAAPMCAN